METHITNKIHPEQVGVFCFANNTSHDRSSAKSEQKEVSCISENQNLLKEDM